MEGHSSQTQLTMACHPAFNIYMLPKRKATLSGKPRPLQAYLNQVIQGLDLANTNRRIVTLKTRSKNIVRIMGAVHIIHPP